MRKLQRRVFRLLLSVMVPAALLLTALLSWFFTNTPSNGGAAAENPGVAAIFVPVAVFVLTPVVGLSYSLSRRLTALLVKTLDDIESAEAYEELQPYTRRSREREAEIHARMLELSNRAHAVGAILENMREGLILIDTSGIVLMSNKGVAAIFGEIRQTNILHVNRDEKFRQTVRKCLAGENAELPLERGGRRYSAVFSPVSGGKLGAVILFLDMTERYEAERQRREFSANVSHELKTPLTSVLALSEMIENGMVKDGDVRAFAARISEQAGRLFRIIDDIIKLSEFDEGRGVRDKEAFDLYAAAEAAVAALRNDRVSVALTGTPMGISANRRMIDELLTNVIDNAIKYNRDGGSVSVELSKDGGFCKIAVRDTGIGIPEEAQSRVFERFYRVDPSRSKKTGGTGLGLSIVKHTAERHGGRVELCSSLGAGTTVTCWLPADS
ncbi:MAG: histidine kinase [Oscillospiraceae bacterium]|jgi:two-component system phosphate regulon sensor histidine kinase PhoR|nr:histidine kinase [Oscillospiraceae bacterium]